MLSKDCLLFIFNKCFNKKYLLFALNTLKSNTLIRGNPLNEKSAPWILSVRSTFWFSAGSKFLWHKRLFALKWESITERLKQVTRMLQERLARGALLATSTEKNNHGPNSVFNISTWLGPARWKASRTMRVFWQPWGVRVLPGRLSSPWISRKNACVKH